MKREREKREDAFALKKHTHSVGHLSAELVEMPAWLPEAMRPGYLMLLRNRYELRAEGGPHSFWAVLACPQCGTFGLISEKQYRGEHSVLCGNEVCGCHFFIEDRARFERAPIH